MRSLSQWVPTQEKNRVRYGLLRAMDPEVFIHEVIGAQNVRVEGNEIVHSCPLPWGLHAHGDQNASASFNTEMLVFNCWVCGGGDVFWLTENVLDLSPREALQRLEEAFTLKELSGDDLLQELELMWDQGEGLSYAIPSYSESLIRNWVRPNVYFERRGVSEETQVRMKTGVDMKNLDKVEEEWLEQPRVTIPHFWNHKLVGWVKRKIHHLELGPKYKNSPQFPRKLTLYGDWEYCQSQDEVIVVESPLSVLVLQSLGVRNVLGTFGAEVTPRQLELLRQWDRVVLFMDQDEAGFNATRLCIEELKDFTLVYVVENPHPNTDPGDLKGEECLALLSDKQPWLLSSFN